MFVLYEPNSMLDRLLWIYFAKLTTRKCDNYGEHFALECITKKVDSEKKSSNCRIDEIQRVIPIEIH